MAWNIVCLPGQKCRTQSPYHLRIFRNQDILAKGFFQQMVHAKISGHTTSKKDWFFLLRRLFRPLA